MAGKEKAIPFGTNKGGTAKKSGLASEKKQAKVGDVKNQSKPMKKDKC